MNRIFKFFAFSKRRKFIFGVGVLSVGIFIAEYQNGLSLFAFALFLSIITATILYFSVKEDVNEAFFYPILILPFFYTLSFSFFYQLVPERFLTKIMLTSLYAFGLYSLFLTENIFAVSAIRTITLLRSARIVAYIITIIVFFLLTNIVFSLRLPIYFSPIVIFLITFLLNFQSLWTYSLSRDFISQDIVLSSLISLVIVELALILNLWPIDASIYSLFLTGMFYSYSGLTHFWVEKRLFKGVLWEYVWVGFLAILILIMFSNWGF